MTSSETYFRLHISFWDTLYKIIQLYYQVHLVFTPNLLSVKINPNNTNNIPECNNVYFAVYLFA